MEEDMCTEKYGSEFTEAVKAIKSDGDGNIDPQQKKTPKSLTFGQ